MVEIDDAGPGAARAAVAALGLEPRDLVLFLEPGDRLVEWALFNIAEPPWRNPRVDLVYWDDDLLDGFGRLRDPRFRPAWSPETLLGANYLGRSFAIRSRVLGNGAGLRVELGDAMWWDLLLGADLCAEQTERIPVVLAHLVRRPLPTRASSLLTVQEHLDRRQERARVTMPADTVHLTWEVDRWPTVSVIIPTRHNRPLVERCLRSLTRTDYERFDVVVVDNGEHTAENESWYRREFADLDLTVQWWDRPFNYSAVNNAAASTASGELLVFLNDDTEVVDPGWLHELASWARRPELGVVGLQLLNGADRIQHGGVILGINGFADHLFAGMKPGVDTIFGSTNWYRNVLAVTAACLAVRRELFDRIGGFDERFVLCGSDVTLGLDTTLAGKRNLCLPSNGVRHLEAATRGTKVPGTDFFASYWRYQRWVFGGDPYFSPNLSLLSGQPELRGRHEAGPHAMVSEPLGRHIGVFRQKEDRAEAAGLADMFRATDADVERVRSVHAAGAGTHPPRSVTWFLPDVDSPFYGGLNTALRIADYLARTHDVENRFAIWAEVNDAFFRSALAAAFPSLADCQISFCGNTGSEELARLPESDVAVATLWATAFTVAKLPWSGRRFYLIQDFEPAFYPAGTLYALAEETYRLGLYGLCNTEHMLDAVPGSLRGPRRRVHARRRHDRVSRRGTPRAHTR